MTEGATRRLHRVDQDFALAQSPTRMNAFGSAGGLQQTENSAFSGWRFLAGLDDELQYNEQEEQG